MTTPALLPCPFCGSIDVSFHAGSWHDFFVCGKCDAEGPAFSSKKTDGMEQAIAAWNQRSAWQPIETAPGDGTEVFVWDGAKAVVAVSEHDFFGDVIHWPIDEWGDKRPGEPPVHATHWRPRLSPPPITP